MEDVKYTYRNENYNFWDEKQDGWMGFTAE